MKIDSQDISVVVQGAIDSKLTPICLKSIRKHLPQAEIILSTWEGTDVSGLDYDVLVLNKDPGGYLIDETCNIYNNVNRQILSVKNGLYKASKKYALKIRSDIEILNLNFIRKFFSYPKRNDKCLILKKRIVIQNLYCASPNKTPFLCHISDWIQYGLTEDIKNLWDIPLEDKRDFSYFKNKKLPDNWHVMSQYEKYLPEQYIWMTFLNKNGIKLRLNHICDNMPEKKRLSELSFANNVIIMNYEDFGIKFLKYDPYKWDYNAQYTHFEWLLLYKKYCDNKFRLPIRYTYKKELKIEKYLLKLKKHIHNFITPVRKFLRWLLEPLSILFYCFKIFIRVITRFYKLF